MYHRNILTLCMALLGFTMLSFTNPHESARIESETVFHRPRSGDFRSRPSYRCSPRLYCQGFHQGKTGYHCKIHG